MPSKRTHEIVATVGTYRQDGHEKKRYVNCGSAFTDDQGRISLKLDTIPVSPEWSGWLSLYPVEEQSQRRPSAQQQRTNPQEARRVNTAHKQPIQDEPVTDGMEDEDIPF